MWLLSLAKNLQKYYLKVWGSIYHIFHKQRRKEKKVRKHSANTMCRGDPPSVKIVNGDINVAEDSIRAIPYVGPVIEARMNNEEIAAILDFLAEFSGNPAMTAKAIEKRLGELYEWKSQYLRGR